MYSPKVKRQRRRGWGRTMLRVYNVKIPEAQKRQVQVGTLILVTRYLDPPTMGNRQPARCNKHLHTLFHFLHIAKHWALFLTEEIGLYLRAIIDRHCRPLKARLSPFISKIVNNTRKNLNLHVPYYTVAMSQFLTARQAEKLIHTDLTSGTNLSSSTLRRSNYLAVPPRYEKNFKLGYSQCRD
jgi:hypothetical protein